MAVVPRLEHGLGFGSTEFHVLRPHREIVPDYLYQFVSAAQFRRDAERHMTGAVGQRRVPASHLADQPVPIPPAQEQRRIVAQIEKLFSVLDEGVDRLTKACSQLATYRRVLLKRAGQGKITAEWRKECGAEIETAKQLLARVRVERDTQYARQIREWKAAVHDWEEGNKQGNKPAKPPVLQVAEQLSPGELSDLPKIPRSWRYVRLSEIARVGSGMSVSKSRKVADPIEIPYLSVANVQRGYLDLSRVKSMRIEREYLPALQLKRWDVLFNEGGDRDKLGRGWVWESQIDLCITQNHVFRASPFLSCLEHSKWISHWGNSFGQRYFETQGKQTTNLASINKTVLSRFPIPLPPINEQVEIVRRLDMHSPILSHVDQSITAALMKFDALRQSILKKAFSGQLVPQDPSDEPASALLDSIKAERERVTKRRTARKTGRRRARKPAV